MRLDNHTHYDRRALRTVLQKVYRHICKLEGRTLRRWSRGFTIRAGYVGSSMYGYSGWAWLGGAKHYWANRSTPDGRLIQACDVNLRLPKEAATTHGFGSLVYHELMHSFGYRHKQYNEIPAAELERVLGPNQHL